MLCHISLPNLCGRQPGMLPLLQREGRKSLLLDTATVNSIASLSLSTLPKSSLFKNLLPGKRSFYLVCLTVTSLVKPKSFWCLYTSRTPSCFTSCLPSPLTQSVLPSKKRRKVEKVPFSHVHPQCLVVVYHHQRARGMLGIYHPQHCVCHSTVQYLHTLHCAVS